MSTTYRSARRDQQVADDFTKSQHPCKFCGLQTDVDTLNTYGARCFDCYRDYCGQGRSYPELTRAARVSMAAALRQVLAGGLRPNPRRYMADLARRVDAGEASTGQRGFMVAARKLPVSQS